MKSSHKHLISFDVEREIAHGIRVSNLAYKVAKQLELPESTCYELAVAGMLHDIGKLKISGCILQKADSLVVEEIKYVRLHAELGYEILKDRGYSDFVLESIYFHHENYDGSGYPKNLKEDEIPLGARILRVCDVFSALTSKRSYRDAFDEKTAISMMIDEVKNFDMRIFLAFQKTIHEEKQERGEKILC